VFPPWKIEAPVISPGPCISNSHRVTFVGRRKKRTLEMTYAYYVCATVIDDETATLQHTHTGFFISSCFSGPSTKGPIWFRWPVTKHKKSWCVYVALCLVPWVCVCVCVCTYSLVSPSFSFSRMRSRVLQTSSSFHPSPVNMKSDNNNNTQKGIGRESG
jgi:hypothetical protein